MPIATVEVKEVEPEAESYVEEEVQETVQPEPQQVAQQPQPAQLTQQEPAPNEYEKFFHSELCFISLVLGVFGLIMPLFSTLAIVFGIGGLMQIHREKMQGKWMAITGIVLGFLGIAIIIVAIIFGIQFLERYLLNFGSLETLIGRLQ